MQRAAADGSSLMNADRAKRPPRSGRWLGAQDSGPDFGERETAAGAGVCRGRRSDQTGLTRKSLTSLTIY